MKIRVATMAVIAVGFLFAASLLANDPVREQKLQQAIDLIESKGDVARAIPLLEDVATSSDRALAARALLYLAQTQERTDKTQARRTYERIVHEFSSESAAADTARARLAALGTSGSDAVTDRVVAGGADRFGSSELSGDGRYLLFPDFSTGGPAIQNMATGEVTHLAHGPASDNLVPRWSPDGKLVSYWWAGSIDGKPVDEVRVVSSRPGSEPQTLWSSRSSVDLDHLVPHFWSADGKALLVDMPHADRTWQFGWLSVADRTIHVLASFDWRRPDNPGQRRPSLSPDGKYIVYSALATNPTTAAAPPADLADERIYILATDGSMQSELTKTAGLNRQPIWSADGRYVLFLSSRAGSTDLWAVAVQQGKAQGTPFFIKKDIGLVTPTRMTTSGTYYYVRSADVRPQVSISAFRAGAPPQTLTEPLFGGSPAWSPDGRSIAVIRTGADNASSLVVRALETGEERKFSAGQGDSVNAISWLHDGAGLIVTVGHADPSTVAAGAGGRGSRGVRTSAFYRADLRSGTLEELKRAPGLAPAGGFSTAALSQDDQTLFFLEAVTGPVRVVSALSLKTGQSRRVFELPDGPKIIMSAPSLSPDGRSLVFETWTRLSNEKEHLARIGADGTGFQEFGAFDFGSGAGGPIWSTDSHAVYFGQTEGGARASRIMRASPDGGAPQPTGVQCNGLTGFALDPTQSRIACAQIGAPWELRALENVGSLLKAGR